MWWEPLPVCAGGWLANQLECYAAGCAATSRPLD
jgi:hypothetical protein